MAKKKSTSNTVTFKVGRDAGSGRFIPVKAAKQRKRTAIVETVTRPKGRRKK